MFFVGLCMFRSSHPMFFLLIFYVANTERLRFLYCVRKPKKNGNEACKMIVEVFFRNVLFSPLDTLRRRRNFFFSFACFASSAVYKLFFRKKMCIHVSNIRLAIFFFPFRVRTKFRKPPSVIFIFVKGCGKTWRSLKKNKGGEDVRKKKKSGVQEEEANSTEGREC